MDGKVDYGPSPQTSAGGPDAAAQFYTSKYIRDLTTFAVDSQSVAQTLGWAHNLKLQPINVMNIKVLWVALQ